MKKINVGAIICSVMILISACGICAVSVSALSLDGESILSQLSSVGTSIGIDIGPFVSTTAESTAGSTVSSEDAEEQLGEFLNNLNATLDVQFVTDMISGLQSGKSFSDLIYEQFGDGVEIPDAVREMSATDVMMYLLSAALNPSESTAQTATGSDYIFTTTETQPTTGTEKATERETESRSSVIIYPSNVTTAAWKTGDVNNDGNITAADARLALRTSAKLDTLSTEAFNAADVNGDGVITAKDARSILRYSAKISNSF